METRMVVRRVKMVLNFSESEMLIVADRQGCMPASDIDVRNFVCDAVQARLDEIARAEQAAGG